MKEIEIAPYSETKYLMTSSSFFMLPSYYAYSINERTISLLVCMTSIISANYWRKCTYSTRRNLDLVMSKIMLAIFSYKMTNDVTRLNYMIIIYPSTLVIVYNYNKSKNLQIVRNGKWYIYHMSNHMIMSVTQFIILHGAKYTEGTNDKRFVITAMTLLYLLFIYPTLLQAIKEGKYYKLLDLKYLFLKT